MATHHQAPPDIRPKVTGLSPKEGIPGTKIVIRGENLGRNPEDITGLTICGVNCLMFVEWKSSSKILARTGLCEGFGDVIVTTKSGGEGTCTVQFRGLHDIISPTKESSVWIEDDEYFLMNTARIRSTSSPSIYPQDPLGLSTDKPDSGTVKSSLKDYLIREYFPETLESSESGNGSGDKEYGNAFSPHFIPAWYLLECHSATSFDDLCKGLEHLKSKLDEKTPSGSNLGPIALLKPYVLSIIDCLDAMKQVSIALKKDKQELGSDLTYKIEEMTRNCLDEAHEIFDSVLARKDLADSTRNALNVLQRYRFLFNLPSTIERNIQKNEYEIVINDYNRAKSLFADTQVRVFQRVYEEVESRISKFRTMLHEKLKKSCSNPENRNIEELKKLIQHLTALEIHGNPGWESIVRIKENLVQSMNESREKHLNLLKAPKITTDDRSAETDVDDIDGLDGYGNGSPAPQTVQFIKELTCIFNKSFPDLAKLGTAYIRGDLYTKETPEQLEVKEQIFNAEMVQKPIEIYVNLIRASLIPTSVKNIPDIEPWPVVYDESFLVWLPCCLKICSEFSSELSKSEPLPNNCTAYVQQLLGDLKVHSLVCLFNQAAEEVKLLYTKEDWNITTDDAIGTRSQLPVLFEQKVVEILKLVRENILQTNTPDEVDIFSKINVQGQMKQLAQNLLLSFLITLEKTLKSSPPDSAKTRIRPDDTILIVICNCAYTTNHVIPKIYETFEKYNYPDMRKVIQVIQGKYRDLENKMLNHYMDRKCGVAIESVKISMYSTAKEAYQSNLRPCDVSFYIKELMATIIEIQSRIFLIAPSLVRRVVTNVIESALKEVVNLFDAVSSKLSETGNLQAHIDLSALEYVFADVDNYQSPKSEKLLTSGRSKLQPFASQTGHKLMSKILTRFKNSMKLQLSCFQWSNDQTIIAM